MFVGEGYLFREGIRVFCIHKVLPNDTDTSLSLFCSFNTEMLVIFFIIEL